MCPLKLSPSSNCPSLRSPNVILVMENWLICTPTTDGSSRTSIHRRNKAAVNQDPGEGRKRVDVTAGDTKALTTTLLFNHWAVAVANLFYIAITQRSPYLRCNPSLSLSQLYLSPNSTQKSLSPQPLMTDLNKQRSPIGPPSTAF